jgi:hypothetical protein
MPNVLLFLDGDLLRRVDRARGGLPRVRWIRRAIRRALDMHCPAPGCDYSSSDPDHSICPRHGMRVVQTVSAEE